MRSLSLELNEKGELSNADRQNLSEYDLKKFVRAIRDFKFQVSRIEKNWAGVYRSTLRDFPLTLRYGTIPKSILWKYYPDLYRPDIELGRLNVRKFISLTRAYKFRDEFSGHHPKMNLGLFSRYCKVAYMANFAGLKIDTEMSGLEMYRRYADGRDGGLSELPLDSDEAFEKWYRSARAGSHPWEIYRGGNTTHIDLGVMERHQGWSVYLGAMSTTRMVEAIRIALALTDAGLTIEVPGAESYAKRLLAMDNVGIIPSYRMNHRAAQDFAEEDEVFDCAHLDELPRRNRILPFISWKPLELARALATGARIKIADSATH